MSLNSKRLADASGCHRSGLSFVGLIATVATVATVAALSPAVSMAIPVTVPGFTYVKSAGGIDEYRLESNGLQVLVKPDHSAPVVSFQVTYRVGSKNEVTGTTGATHILEHLMFKGSTHFNDPAGNSVKQYLEARGAGFNATTSFDRTNYFATLGKDDLEGDVAIEADRMRNLWLHAADKTLEMTVVRNEYERGENSPGNALSKEVHAAAFQALPYHHDTIGWSSDIEGVSVDQLRAFYDTYYWPDNATVTFVGDVTPEAALNLVQKYYGGFPKAPKAIPAIYTQEPVQTGARRVIVKRPGQVGSLLIAYKVPEALNPDLPALDVLGEILSNGKNSRFYRALIDTNLALAAQGGVEKLHDAGLFELSATLVPGVTHEQVEKVLLAEVDKVKARGVTAAEIEPVIRQFRAAEAFNRDGTDNVVGELNEWIANGDWTQYVTYGDRMTQVTPADVQRVAKQYLNEDQSTTGWFVPQVSP